MAIYAIYACEGTYGGLHGINNYFFEDCVDDHQAEEYGRVASYDVMDSYGSIEEDFYSEAESMCENEDDIENYVDQLQTENIEYMFTRLRPDCPLTLEELNARCFDEFFDFVEQYGEEPFGDPSRF